MDKKNVLLIDDDEVNLYLLTMLLENNYDINIYNANCANDAMVILGRYKIDLILSDVMMPNVSGFDLVEYLETQNDYKNIPLYFVTAMSDDEIIVKNIKNNPMVKGVIHKPLSLELITEYLSEVLS